MSARPGLVAALTALLVLLAAPSGARGDFGLVPGSVHAATLNATGRPELRAGAHPDRMIVSFALNTAGGDADGNLKDLAIDLPAGFTGDADAVPSCSRTAFEQRLCGPESQVGEMRVSFAGATPITFPIYDLPFHADELAELGFFAVTFPTRLVVRARSEGDHGTQIALRDLPQNLPLTAAEVELWGVPADRQSGTAIPRKPFLTSPTSCAEPPAVTVGVRSWQAPEQWISDAAQLDGPLNGCEELAFAPRLDVWLDRPAPDTPSGMSVELTVPQDDDPDGRATSRTRDVAVTFPGGLTLSPGVADGLSACDDEQLRRGTSDPPACPPSSKIGSVELTSRLLGAPLQGAIYLGRALPGDRFRLFVTAAGRSVMLKLGASLQPDPETGQLLMLLPQLPELPFDRIELHFKDGPRAPIATPRRCGAGIATARVTPYRGGPPAQIATTIEIGGVAGGPACALTGPFAPRFLAGSSPPVAGAGSAFTMTARRADGEQTLERLTMALPAGLSARLAHVTRCSEAQAAGAACPAASRVGAMSAEAGAGPSPLPLAGETYLTGPYAGAPFGLALVLRAQAGPIDLGTVVIRAALRVDPDDAHLTVATDPLPRMLAGVPLRLRAFSIAIDRRGFMVNPSSCREMRVAATLTSLDEAIARASSRYALGGCGRLPFSPTVALSLGPAAQLRRGGHPQVAIALAQPRRQAALRSARIELPGALRIDPSAISTICTRRRAGEGRCPRGSVVGSAQARSPLLPTPLTGSIAVVQPSRGVQPDLWATVAGSGVRLTVRATTSAAAGRPVVTRLAGLPDIPLSQLRLSLRAGRHGLLSLATGLCAGTRARQIAVRAELQGQNDKRRAARVRVDAAPRCSHGAG